LNIPATLIQIGTIARYECAMQWRRRAMLVMTLAMLVVAAGSALLVHNELELRDALAKNSETFTSGLISFTFIPIGAVLAMVMPFVLADTIPKDQQLGVRELFNSTPLRPVTYLAGKLLGGWISVLSSVLVVVVVTGVVWWVLVGPFDLVEYAVPWLIGAVSMTVINISLIILLAAGQPDARRAVLVAILVVVVLPGVIGFDTRGNWLDMFNPLRPGIFFHYTDIVTANPDTLAVEADPQSDSIKLLSVEVSILTGLAQVALAWVVVWIWTRRRA
jgi:hypothetical protein